MYKQGRIEEKQKNRQYFMTGLVTFSFLYSLKHYVNARKDKRLHIKEIHRLNSIPVKSVQDAISELQNNPKSRQTYFIEGQLTSGEIQSKILRTPLIFRVNYNQNIFSNDLFLKPELHFDWNKQAADCTIDKQAYFKIIDRNGRNDIKVSLIDGVDLDSALTNLGYKDKPRLLSFGEHLAHWMTLLCTSMLRTLGPATIVQALAKDNTFRGVHIAVRENEFAIKAEGFLQVLGSLIYDSETKQFRIDNPLIITISKKRNITKLERSLGEKQALCTMWGFGVFVTGLYLARRVFLYNKEHPQLWAKVKSILSRLRQRALKKNTQETTYQQPPQYSTLITDSEMQQKQQQEQYIPDTKVINKKQSKQDSDMSEHAKTIMPE